MSKPDWKDAPEWADWLAMDSDNAWFWHELKPVYKGNHWGSEGRVEMAGELKWGETLEERSRG